MNRSAGPEYETLIFIVQYNRETYYFHPKEYQLLSKTFQNIPIELVFSRLERQYNPPHRLHKTFQDTFTDYNG